MRFVIPLLILTIVTGCDGKTEPEEPRLEKLWPVPAFKLTNQHGEPFGNEQVAGKTWIATLFFSTCPGPCPMMTERLKEIQAAVNDPNVLLVSISVDPDTDTVQVLKQYADNRDADPKRWFFLTGPWDDAHKLAQGLKLDFDKRDPKTNEISHSTQFLLIDKYGYVRGIYRHDEEESIKQLKLDAPILAAEG